MSVDLARLRAHWLASASDTALILRDVADPQRRDLWRAEQDAAEIMAEVFGERDEV